MAAAAALIAVVSCCVTCAEAFTFQHGSLSHRGFDYARSRSVPQATSTEERGVAARRVVCMGAADGGITRREVLTGAAAVAVGVSLASYPEPAEASLVMSPPLRLNNRYFLMRSGQSFADAAGQIQTHPIYKLHMSNGLTELGRRQAEKAAESLSGLGAGQDNRGVIIYHDISARCLETANVLCDCMEIGRERVVPEYAFLEPRGMGLWESGNVTAILPALYRADAQDPTWRPPPNDDGTLSESVLDVLVRGRQLMSKLETQFSAEDIVLVSPDSDNLSILQAFVLGEEFFAKHSKFFFRAGEMRPLLLSEKTQTRYEPVYYAKVKAAADA
ncbi:hypothetical protein JKP88DRAFT_71705 [Tribonema minus]|uniref:Uncharacterized protein n=1 Tax=Tribonema minus TaxID=303371 RepID=A0A835Z0I4_9STRA|nr:hypothetical protein JKP88DRAFT_71705 [Tribonema minus]